MMIRFLFIILFAIIQTGLAQSLGHNDLEEQVRGLFLYGNNSYLVTSKGYIMVPPSDINDEYEQYYQTIYGDSTITNPNTVIDPPKNFMAPSYIVPFININDLGENYSHIKEEVFLYDFLTIDETGGVYFRQGAYAVFLKYLWNGKSGR